ncbi:phytoene dehydrogenase-like protein [Friedmanniella endophytica]|uniref:Pyridine nucleotide-disulfide oxidoreductase domain-containing protein 2 n=1 Tax=Microlunatus kandeliicorticis TaxID=1759536 RepID=A0A7W3P7K6_9ACTN|nr:NAD(P)/FAD-dependent oxidoreductase [Microlunatus kandeliicorticis]MBA8796123.1 phytoene dehydrogenase-like protein [Microlunatus kandeliicorticis]
MSETRADVVVVGGGHNGLVAAAYLARAGRRVVVCEARDRFGGAVAGDAVFPGVPARLSRFSYLVSLLPQQLVDDLGLELRLRSRAVASYSPYERDGRADGLLVERPEGEATRRSFATRTGDQAEHRRWQEFHDRIGTLAAAIAPTLTGPLPRAAELADRVDPELWSLVTERPLGELVEGTFADDLVRGTVFTDALIGTESGAHDPTLRQNRCFLYHVVGRGTGEWAVPLGGMGAVADALVAAARRSGAELRERAAVTALDGDGRRWRVVLADGDTVVAPTVLLNCADAVTDRLLGLEPDDVPEGNQLKINMLLRRLPALASGIDPRVAFAGTLHVGQGYRRLAEAHALATAGALPDPLPCEVYCHTLTDPTILAPELVAQGWQTLTLFGLHTPAGLFRADPDGARDRAVRAALEGLQAVLAEPLEDCLARDPEGRPCLEAMSPLDVEAELGMPGGHIFHGDLSWPWLDDDEPAGSAAERWGVATDHPGLLRCGSSSRRGGAVSALGGHSAAMAVLEAAG